ncbi:urease accessory protein UreE [Methyloprofundus sedimenti]|uniref:Urease accessory protein UreE n=1 Tax=Methyloprofundus sedimenti TaxID=1420851 RepID=A0A1V8M264_9GAMM|nr:urease accessory protein UreE [Methyloprofundus sedimenti]OQK15523.1 urease accessory protein UreE [Methyloprofundus sedimenti]
MVFKLTGWAPSATVADDVLTLPFELRQKSRLSAVTDKGEQVALFLERGKILRSGMVLTGIDEFKVLINAAPEPVSVMRCDDPLQLARACYHLGNRHISVQILRGELRYLSDHVLDHMLEGLGFDITQDILPFEPEAGAYHGHGHGH